MPEHSWWDGTPLPGSAVALAVFTAGAPHSAAGATGPVVAAAAAGDRAVLLRGDQLGTLLLCHKQATLVCSGAAALHWTLHDLLTRHHDTRAVGTLWGFSQHARLVDLNRLDAHLRRLADPQDSDVAPFGVIAARVLGVGFPADDDLQHQVLEGWTDPLPSGAESGRELALRLVRAMLDVYGALLAATRSALAPILGELRRLGRLRPRDADGRDDALCEEVIAAVGPLGVASDVRWDIAVGPAVHSGLRVDAGRWNELRRWTEDRYAAASRELLADRHAQGGFRRSGPTVDLLDSGQLRTDTRKLGPWLRAVLEELCDRNNCPVAWTGPPPGNAERWGVWASGHRLLHAWRVLSRAGRFCRAGLTAGRFFPSWDAHSLLPSTAPDLAWLRSSPHRVCVPHEGHSFLVCRLQNLRVRCLARLCRVRWYAGNGRLTGYLLTASGRHLEPFRCWLQAAAGELYAAAEYAGAGSTEPGAFEADGGRVRVAQQFLGMKQARPEEYRRWLQITYALLETLPLGLPPEHLAVLLDVERGLSVGSADVRRYGQLLADQVAYELKGFLADDALDLFTGRLRVPLRDALETLALGEHVDTVGAHVRRELLKGFHPGPVWDMVAAAGLPADAQPDLGQRLLRRRGLSLGGRLTDDAYCAQVRQQEYLLTIDETIKAAAHAVVSRGYRLAAVAGPELVLEIPGPGGDPRIPRRVSKLVRQAQRPLLGSLAAPCQCAWRDDW
jgi:hypothetical protein